MKKSQKNYLFFLLLKIKNGVLQEKHIIGLIGSNPSKEICLFMADIELGENNDKQKSDSWILRSQTLQMKKCMVL